MVSTSFRGSLTQTRASQSFGRVFICFPFDFTRNNLPQKCRNAGTGVIADIYESFEVGVRQSGRSDVGVVGVEFVVRVTRHREEGAVNTFPFGAIHFLD